jgi:hypothetical protein
MSGFENPQRGSHGRVELASRKNAGIQVTLLWAEQTNTVAVLVCDDSTEDQFELTLEPGTNVLDAFEHPYAYAAWCGIDYQQAELPNAA